MTLLRPLALLGISLTLVAAASPERAFAPDPEARVATVNGLEMAWLEAGEGPLVLMVHGFPDTARSWDFARDRIAGLGYRVVTPWTRGYAPSQVAEGDDYGMRTLGEDLIALIEALGYDRAVIVGHDWGAAAAYAAATLAPERVDKLVTVAIPHPATVDFTLGDLWRGRHFVGLATGRAERKVRRRDFARVDALYARWSPTWDAPRDDLEQVKDCFSAPGSLDAALGYYRAVGQDTDFLEQPISTPTLAFAGQDDGVGEVAWYHDAASHFTGGYRVVELPGGHWVHRESPDAFLTELEAFLGPGAGGPANDPEG